MRRVECIRNRRNDGEGITQRQSIVLCERLEIGAADELTDDETRVFIR